MHVETIRQLYPEDRYVTHAHVIAWAFDLMLDDAHAEAYAACRSVEHADLVKNTPQPTLEQAIALLEDIGKATFEKFLITDHFHAVNRMSDALRPVARPCWPKEQHSSKGKALAQMRSIINRGLAKNVKRIHPYVCPHCRMSDGRPAYHVGHA